MTETSLQSQNYILSGPLQKEFASFWAGKPSQCLEAASGDIKNAKEQDCGTLCSHPEPARLLLTWALKISQLRAACAIKLLFLLVSCGCAGSFLCSSRLRAFLSSPAEDFNSASRKNGAACLGKNAYETTQRKAGEKEWFWT